MTRQKADAIGALVTRAGIDCMAAAHHTGAFAVDDERFLSLLDALGVVIHANGVGALLQLVNRPPRVISCHACHRVTLLDFDEEVPECAACASTSVLVEQVTGRPDGRL